MASYLERGFLGLVAFARAAHPGGVQHGGQSPIALDLPAAKQAVTSATTEETIDTSERPVTLARLLLSFAWVGSISIGHSSATYLMDELVHRRKWLRREHWLEGLVLGRVLPGPVGVSVAMFLGHLLRGRLGAGLGLTVFVLPGLIFALALSLLIYDLERPPWATGVIQGISASALGFFCLTCLRTIPDTRKVRLGPIAAIAAFIAQAMFHLDIFLIIAGVGVACLLRNLPQRRREGEG